MTVRHIGSIPLREFGPANPVLYRLAAVALIITLAALTPTTLTAQGTLKGTVLSALDSSPVRWALLTLESARSERYRTFSDSVGAFTISDIRPGTYSLRVQALEYERHFETVAIEGSDRLAITIVLKGLCPYDSLAALRDISQNRPKIVEPPSLAPLALAPWDIAFQTKYGVEYVPLGDSDVVHHACIDQHNRVIFMFLDEKYGTEWRRFLRTP